jgi:arylformamidase
MIDETLEKNYVIGKLRHDLSDLMESWAARSASYRTVADAALDQPYGDDPREKIDIFYCVANDAPLLIYLHGGYWQRGDKSIYSFIARSFVEQDIDVAIVGYPLCPQVSLTELVDSVRKAIIFLFNNASSLKIDRDRFNICGNSAGGHLVTMMMSTHWSDIDSGLPNELIKFGVPISGLYDLEPLRYTTLNEAVRLGTEEAKTNSPRFSKPVSSAPILAAVGGAETPVFFTQMDGLIQSWQSKECVIEQHVEDNADHFDVIECLGDSASELFQNILKRIR